MEIQHEGLKTNIPDFKPGDTLRVHVKVVEGESERVQMFDGVVIGRRGHGIGESFIVRKVSFGVGVERIFPIHSPRIEKIEVLKQGRVRRAKLFHLRKLSGKAARLREADVQEESASAEQKQPVAEAPAPASAPSAENTAAAKN